MGAEPIHQLNTDRMIDADSVLSDTGQKNVKKHLEGIGKFHVPYFIENAVHQFAQGTPVVFLTAYPFQQDVTGKDQGGAADSQVIANPVKLLAQLEQGFADLEAAFNGPAVAVQTDDFGIRKIGVRGKNDESL